MRILSQSLAICLLTLLLALPGQAGAATALEALRTTVDDVLVILRDPSLKGQDQKKIQRDKLIASIKKVFDPGELAQRALGQNWNKFSPEQQSKFVNSFSEVLNRTYLDRIQNYSDEKIIYIGENNLGPDKAEVSTKVVTSTKEIPINYRMLKKDSWKVYDVVIEGVSLVQNYRNQFNQILQKETPAQLLDTLEQKFVAMEQSGK